jgi:methyl-accepting chemotaxis protein
LVYPVCLIWRASYCNEDHEPQKLPLRNRPNQRSKHAQVNNKAIGEGWLMSWRNMTIGKRITFGFGVVLVLLCSAGIMSFTGVGGIVTNAGDVIEGNKLDGTMAQRELDHLNWANKVNALLNDDKITKLAVQTDPHKCAFGKWLYGDGRKHAQELVPSLGPILTKVEDPHAKLHASAISIGKDFKPANSALPGFLAEKESDHLKWTAQICMLFITNGDKLTVQTDPHKCGFGKWLYGDQAKAAVAGNPELEKLLAAIKEPHAKLHATAVEIGDKYKQVHPGLITTLMARLDDHRRWVQKVNQAMLLGHKELGVQTDPTECGLGKWLASEEAQKYAESFPELAAVLKDIKEPHEKLHDSAIVIQSALNAGQRERAQGIFEAATLPALASVANKLNEAIAAEKALVEAQNQAKQIYTTRTQKHLDATRGMLGQMRHTAEKALVGQQKARQTYATQTMPALKQVQGLLHELRSEARQNIMTDEAMLDAAQNTKMLVSLIGAVAVVVGLILAFFIVRGISSVLNRISSRMGQGAEQVAAASEQVAGSSQSLAQGASEQAASLEETSSSMEEMASMTSQNAENAGQADGLMKETAQAVQKANTSMQELRAAMGKLNEASDEMAKIIKTIDEIAFQTNLLALNAAVEAARAGDAGAGFAVVADEVRGLAMRAAEAAKNTTQLIQDNQANIREGAGLVQTTDEAFSQVLDSTDKVAELVGEIAAASNEQSQGIEQINQNTTTMDRVTQQVAANAEESAASSEEMAGQAIALQEMVQELTVLVNGVQKMERRQIAASSEEPHLLPEP